MPDPLLVDTDICIDVIRQYTPTIARLDRADADFTLTLSDVNRMELFVGCGNKQELAQTEKFLRRFQVVPINAGISSLAVDLMRRYRLSHGLLLADSLIAATALVHNMPLLTKNARDFRFVAGLALEPL